MSFIHIKPINAKLFKGDNIGVGMGITGTDVTKSVADMILTDHADGVPDRHGAGAGGHPDRGDREGRSPLGDRTERRRERVKNKQKNGSVSIRYRVAAEPFFSERVFVPGKDFSLPDSSPAGRKRREAPGPPGACYAFFLSG